MSDTLRSPIFGCDMQGIVPDFEVELDTALDAEEAARQQALQAAKDGYFGGTITDSYSLTIAFEMIQEEASWAAIETCLVAGIDPSDEANLEVLRQAEEAAINDMKLAWQHGGQV